MRTAVRLVVLVILGLWPAPVRAEAPCTVPGTYDTFQEALDDPSCDPIMLGAGTFNESVDVERSVEIIGAGTLATIVDGFSPFDPVIEVSEASPTTVTIRGLTVTGGESGGGFRGGGLSIANAPHTVRLVDVAVTGNVGAQNGGGIFLEDGAALSMTGGSVANNQAVSTGGGIGAFEASIALDGVDVLGNKSQDEAGISQFDGGTFSAEDTTIEGNVGPGGNQGAVSVTSVDDISLRDVVIRGNQPGALLIGGTVTGQDLVAEGNTGGGLTVRALVSATFENVAATNNVGRGVHLQASGESVPLRLTNATISGNRSVGGGAGLQIATGTFVGTNLTITNNTADSDGMGPVAEDGGGIEKIDSGSATIRNSIVFGNHDDSPGAEAPDCSGLIISEGHNILGTKSGCAWTDGPGDRFGVNPKLGPLADNGGDTFTHALRRGSAAINNADPTFAPATDQRGLARNPDIGAYERVLCRKVPVNEIGTERDDTLTGGKEANGVLAFGGNDTINTGGGKDAVCAGDGDDKVKGGGGKDHLLGEAGEDKLNGGGGKDRITGGTGKDTCNGGSGTDKGKCEKEKKI